MTGPQLGAVAIKAAIADSGLTAADIDEVIMGCVLSAGLGQAPARQAALGAGLPTSIPTTTVNKMCGSAMRAVMTAADQIMAGSAQVVVAGGLESMTNAPYLLPKARGGYRMGHQEVLDHLGYLTILIIISFLFIINTVSSVNYEANKSYKLLNSIMVYNIRNHKKIMSKKYKILLFFKSFKVFVNYILNIYLIFFI